MHRILTLALLIAALCQTPALAQIDNIKDLLRGGVEDATLLVESYLQPLGNGFGADLNSGWYQSARTHKFLGFDFTVMASVALAPASDEMFNINTLGLRNLRLSDPGGNPNTPTIVGPESPGPNVDIVVNNPLTGQDEILARIQMPQGVGIRSIPSVMLQGSVGIFANTDLILRFFPELNIDNDLGKIRMFGIGAKHSLTQWLGEMPFDLAVVAGITTFQAEANLNINPQSGLPPTGANYNGQRIELKAESLVLNAIISKKIAILTLFSGIGVERSSLDIGMKGTYPITSIETNLASPNFGQLIIQDVVDPISLSFTGANTTRFDVGFQLSLVLLNVYGSYTFSNYPVAHLGVGLSIR